MIDTDNSGQITYEELKDGLKIFGANLTESEFHALMQAVSVISESPGLKDLYYQIKTK